MKELIALAKKLFGTKWSGVAFLMLIEALVIPSLSFAARPLVTDDPDTVGKGEIRVEAGVEAFSWKDTVEDLRVKERGTEASVSFTYGVSESFDVITGFPYVWGKTKEDGVTIFDENGFSDISLEAKWRFYERNGFSLAVKPGITLPTGNHEKGFGTGRATYGLVFIAGKELKPFAFHFNAGYVRNENGVSERKDLWSASVAVTYEILKGLNLVGNIGFVRNANPTVQTAPIFALVGFSYAVSEHVTVDAGYKHGLNKQEVDHSVIAGVTLNF
jgi:hypothetical protein